MTSETDSSTGKKLSPERKFRNQRILQVTIYNAQMLHVYGRFTWTYMNGKCKYTDGRIVRTQRFFETKVRTHSKLEPTNFKIGSKFHFFLHKWLKTKKSLSRPCSRVSGKLCTKCCISYIKRTLDSRTHEVSKGKKCNLTCIND